MIKGMKANIRIDNMTKNKFDQAHRKYQGKHNNNKISQAKFIEYLLELFDEIAWENNDYQIEVKA